MKKRSLFILILVSSLATGCINSSSNKDMSEDEISRQLGASIIESVKNQNSESLKRLFSEHVHNTHNLDSEIEQFYEAIDGKIISYDNPESGSSSGSKEGGIWIKRILGGNIAHIKTNTNKCYHISFRTYYILKSDPTYVGMEAIGIQDYDEETKSMGDILAVIGVDYR